MAHHVAFMKKSRKLIDKILSWEKTIESRWYKSRIAPWNRIQKWDTVFFKNSWESVTAKAEVKKVLQYENIDGNYTNEILQKYWWKWWIFFSTDDSETRKWVGNKKYIILIFLENPVKLEPFNIRKDWFWISCAWISLDNINTIKK